MDPTAVDGMSPRPLYLRLRHQGLAHDEAIRLTGFLVGIPLPGDGPMPTYTMRQIEHLLFLRAMRDRYTEGSG